MSPEDLDPSVLEALGRHMFTGEPFVEADVQNRRQNQEGTYLEPAEPTREVPTEWDDDGPIAWRTRTDEELAAAQEAYRVALAKWQRTGGRFVSLGPQSWEATAKTASGACAEFESVDGVTWYCTSATHPPDQRLALVDSPAGRIVVPIPGRE